MKRGCVILEPWSTKEKLCLASAVLRSGDQNWMSVSRVLRVFGEQDRPAEWYSQKQCALQYEALLNNVGTSKRKKRSDKGVETLDIPSENITRKLLQERLEEVNNLLEEDRKAFMRLKKEKEEIESGRADDRLDEFEQEIEDEKEREAARGSILRQHEERSRLEGGRVTPHCDSQSETKIPTSPLLTSLLRSPSNYRGGSIHNLLNPPPSHSRVNDSPTLSRLLESPAKQIEPTVLFATPVKKEPIEDELNEIGKLEAIPGEVSGSSVIVEEVSSVEPILKDVKTEIPDYKEELSITESEETEADIADQAVQMQEVEVEIAAETDKTVSTTVPERESEEQDGEKEEQSLTNLQDSDTMEEQQSITELDSQTVNMIVLGEGVISVNHDTSSEHLEEVTSSDIQHKDDSEAAESVKDDSLDGASDDVNETIKEVESSVAANIENRSGQSVEVDALNNFIIGPETPKDNYVVQVLCSTPENVLEEDTKTHDVKENRKARTAQDGVKNRGIVQVNDLNVEGAVLEVGGEMVSLGGAVVVEEEEADTTVHEVEVLVSELNTTSTPSVGGKCLEEEDSTQDMDMKDMETPEPETQEESQEEDESSTVKQSTIEANVRETRSDDDKTMRDGSSSCVPVTPKNVTESKPGSPNLVEEDSDSIKKFPKKRLISGSVCSDSKPSSPAPHMLEDSREYRSWKKSIMLVYNRLATHKFASMFLKPITNEQAPAYDTVVQRPVDLFTIKKRIETGDLRTTVEFQRDLLLMFQNAIMYNNSESLVYEMASIMQNECLQHIELMVEAMGEGVPWRKDHVSVDKLHTRARGDNPKRKRTSLEDAKQNVTPKRRKEAST